MDRRGAKTFAMLHLEGFTWGRNLWHSHAVGNMSDTQVRQLLSDADVVLFDEMVQHARRIASLRHRLESLGISVTSIALVRRRSHFLDGETQDPDLRAVDDLDDAGFAEAAIFLSRLLARRNPPMDVEHPVITGLTDPTKSTAEMVGALAGMGENHSVWETDPDEADTVDAFTLDRPRFFDMRRVVLPDGFRAEWDGPVKIRLYRNPVTGQIVCTFVAFPTLHASPADWARVVRITGARYGGPRREKDQSAERSPASVSNLDVVKAYVDLCMDISLELAKQSLEAGVLLRLGVNELAGTPQEQLTGVFGKRRGNELSRAVRGILSTLPQEGVLDFSEDELPPRLDQSRRITQESDRLQAREALLAITPLRWDSTGGGDTETVPLSYSELMRGTAPLDEGSVSVALDYELDAGTMEPTQHVFQRGGRVWARRAFWRGEYNDTDVRTYSSEVIRRTRVVCANALSLWLRERGLPDEGGLHLAKLFANLVHDWSPELPPIAMRWVAYKFGPVPNLPPPQTRYLVPILVKSHWLEARDRRARSRVQRRYAPPSTDTRWRELFGPPLCSGSVTARVKGMVKAYAAIQRECKIEREASPSGEMGVFSDPVVVLAAARNERTAYLCGLFEIRNWIRIGKEHLFPDLADFAQLDSEPSERDPAHEWIVEFAQASRLLFEKLNMYRHLGPFREQLVELFESHSLEAGDIILDSVDHAPRFAESPSDSRYPVGLLLWAMGVIRPFTSLVRQVLTLAKYDKDTRSQEEQLEVREDGTPRKKDAEYYLTDFVANTPQFSVESQRIRAAIDETTKSQRLSPTTVSVLASVFTEIVKVLETGIWDLKDPNGFEDRLLQREGGLLKVGREISRFRAGYVAVGDFYNFVSFVSHGAPVGLLDPFSASESVQQFIADRAQEVIAQVGSDKVSYAYLGSDTIALAGPDPLAIFSASLQLREAMKADTQLWDRDVADRAIHYVRLGIAKFEDARSAFLAPIVAAKIAEADKRKRGSITVTEGAYIDLPATVQAMFGQSVSYGKEPSQVAIRILSPDPQTGAQGAPGGSGNS